MLENYQNFLHRKSADFQMLENGNEHSNSTKISILDMTKINPKKCIGCGACISVCPAKAISFKDSKAFIDQKKCKKCYECVKICPVKAISK